MGSRSRSRSSRQQEQQAAGQKSGNEQARQQAKKPKLNCLPYQRSHQKLRQKGYCKGKAPQACIVRPSHSTGVLQPPQARCLAALFVDKSGAWLEVLAGRQASCDSAPLRQTPRSFLARGRPSRLRNHLLGQRSSTRRHLRTANQRNKSAKQNSRTNHHNSRFQHDAETDAPETTARPPMPLTGPPAFDPQAWARAPGCEFSRFVFVPQGLWLRAICLGASAGAE